MRTTSANCGMCSGVKARPLKSPLTLYSAVASIHRKKEKIPVSVDLQDAGL